MSSAVLGKRSRTSFDVEEVSLPLPARKRRTRNAIPYIHEDDAQSPKDAQEDAESMVLDCPIPRRIVSTKHTVRNQYAPPSLENNENVPPTSEDIPIPFEFKTPSTTRFKNALASPVTPKHRVRLGGSTLLTPRTPRTVQAPASKSNAVFAAARQLFVHSGTSSKLVGRDAERLQLRGFIAEATKSNSGGCTYISGPPGTGKSALTQEILDEFGGDEHVKIANVNCVSLGSIKEVHSQLVREFCAATSSTKQSDKNRLASLFTSKKSKVTTYLVLLDEIDNLLNDDCDVLYSLFEWSLQKQSSLILIGIANALDLTDRFLPRLKSRNLKPELLPFLPYTAAQMSNIITDKLRSTLPEDTTASKDFVPFVHPMAVQLCCKKVGSQTGDLRKAFSLIRQAIDQVEEETAEKEKASVPKTPLKDALVEISNQRYPPSPPNSIPLKPLSIEEIFSPKSRMPVMTPETAPRATVAHIARIATRLFNNGTISRLGGLNIQQKAVLCCLVANEQKRFQRDPFATPSRSASTVPTVKDLFTKYSMLCKREEGILQILKNTEFRDVVASLETLGLVHEWSGRSTSLLTPTRTPTRSGKNVDDRQLASAVSEKEMKESLSGAGGDLLRGLFEA